MNKDGILYTIIFSTLSSVLLVFILALIYTQTADKVEENKKKVLFSAALKAIHVDFDAKNFKDIKSKFDEHFPEKADEHGVLHTTLNDKEVLLAPFSGKGLWGEIKGKIALSKDIDKIIGLVITDQEETPGLGGRIGEDWFQDQFSNETLTPGMNLEVKKGSGTGDKDPDNNTVDAIGGATLTSGYFQTLINNAINNLREEYKGNE